MITEEIGQLILDDFPCFVHQSINDPTAAFIKFGDINIGIRLNNEDYKDGIHIDCIYCRVSPHEASSAYTIIDIANPNYKKIIEKFITDHNHV